MQDLIPYKPSIDSLISLALNGIVSPHTRRAYEAALGEFLTWAQGQQSTQFSKAMVQGYKTMLIAKQLAPSSINQRLAAVRRFAEEAADNGLLNRDIATAIMKVHGVQRRGVRLGRWLTKQSVEELLRTTNDDTLRSTRDRAVLALLFGGGLRRGEAVKVVVEQIRRVENRWAIVDLLGKHGRIRTVPIPDWAKAVIDQWLTASGITNGTVLRRVRHVGRRSGEPLSAQTIYDIVVRSVRSVDPDIRPHDLRRTFARLAYEGHAPLEQLSMTRRARQRYDYGEVRRK